MLRWLAGRLTQAAITLILAAVVIFVVMRVAPGDPLTRLSDERPIAPEEVRRLRELYCLDCPMHVQLGRFARGIAHGDLGTSIHFSRPVTQLIAERLPATLLLGGTALLLNFTLGIWLGVRQALRRGRAFDHVVGTVSLVAYALPSFWVALVLAGLVGVRWRLLPVAGMHDPLLASPGPWASAVDVARHLVLPVLTLVTVTIAAAMRYQRSAMLAVLRLPYVAAARARGLSERRVIWRHAWPNALFPVVTLFGLWLPLLVSGSLFVEYVFAWPGLGALAAGAAAGRDYPLLMGTALLAAALVVVGALVTDILYALLDPRVREA